MNTTTKYKSKPLWCVFDVVFWLAIFSALSYAMTSVMDTYVIGKSFLGVDTLPSSYVLTPEVKMVNALAYLIMGGWLGTLTAIPFNRKFGKMMQEDFVKESFMSLRQQVPALVTGLLAAVFTVTTLYVATSGDPSYLIALGGFCIVFLVLFESILLRDKTTLADFVMRFGLGLLALMGSALVSLENLGYGKATIRWEVVFLMVFVVGITMAISRLMETRYAQALGGPVNFNFWRFLWLAITGTILAFVYAAITGALDLLVKVLSSKFLVALLPILLTMFFAYMGNISRMTAQARGGDRAASRVSITLCLQAIFAIPLSLLAFAVLPSIYTVPKDPAVWGVRAIGVFLVLIAVVALELIHRKMREE